MKIRGQHFCAVVLLVSLGGCATPARHATQPAPPLRSFHTETAGGSGVAMRRVAVLPLASETSMGASLNQLDNAFVEELTKTSLFELVPVSRDALEARFGRRQFSSVEILPGELLQKLRADYGVDGVLFTDLTHYRPYRPLAIGVRSKLVDVQSGQVRWAFDHLFDSGNVQTANAAENYYLGTIPPPAAPLKASGGAVLQSPSRFSKYVAWEAYRSLLETPALSN